MRVKTLSPAILLLGLIVAPCLALAAEPKEGWFTTNDGVKLHYLEAGSGNPLVMIPGWSQSAMEFKYQLAGLSAKYHVYALDMRGHGESAKPNHGYRIQRLSADVHDFLVANNLGDWRDLIPAINIPTLVVGGKASLVPWKSQVW